MVNFLESIIQSLKIIEPAIYSVFFSTFIEIVYRRFCLDGIIRYFLLEHWFLHVLNALYLDVKELACTCDLSHKHVLIIEFNFFLIVLKSCEKFLISFSLYNLLLEIINVFFETSILLLVYVMIQVYVMILKAFERISW